MKYGVRKLHLWGRKVQQGEGSDRPRDTESQALTGTCVERQSFRKTLGRRVARSSQAWPSGSRKALGEVSSQAIDNTLPAGRCDAPSGRKFCLRPQGFEQSGQPDIRATRNPGQRSDQTRKATFRRNPGARAARSSPAKCFARPQGPARRRASESPTARWPEDKGRSLGGPTGRTEPQGEARRLARRTPAT